MRLTEPQRCQLHSRLAALTPWQWLQLKATALSAQLNLAQRLKALFGSRPKHRPRIGTPSKFPVGSWVRVKDAESIFATLNIHKKLRGLRWIWQQWPYCGSVHQVFKQVRRTMGDDYRLHAVSATVLLESAPCSGPLGLHGCGRDCPLMFRDEWLEEAAPPPESPPNPAPQGPHATVRSAEVIRRSLDHNGCHGGLMFMPEMYDYVGLRFPVRRQIDQVLAGAHQAATAQPIYILAGLHCAGAILAADGPCDRGCRLLWHRAWLDLES